jgi:sugar lactone lactonase YvrE
MACEGILRAQFGRRPSGAVNLVMAQLVQAEGAEHSRVVTPATFLRRSSTRAILACAASVALLASLLVWFFGPTIGEPVLTELRGTEISIERGTSVIAPTVGIHLRATDVLRTASNSFAAVTFGPEKTRLILSPETALRFGSYRPRKQLELRHGKLDAKVARQRPFYPLTIQTPNAAVRVLGTRLTVAVATNLTQLAVAEGKARLTRTADSAHVDVPANYYAIATPNGPLTVLPFTTKFAFTNFVGRAGGGGNVDGIGSTARFANPTGLAVDQAGNVYVADTANHTIRKVTPTGVVTTVAGSAGQSGSLDGVADDARFNWPCAVAVDDSGNLYVADGQNYTIRKISPGGLVTTLAGSAGQRGSNDGAGAAARFALSFGLGPSGVAVDRLGDIFVADTENHTIRKITPAGVVSTLAGSAGQRGTANGTGAAARFSGPTGVVVDRLGNVFVADSQNATLRMVTPAGEVTTIAGSPGEKGTEDGMAIVARFGLANYEGGPPHGPSNLAIDASGTLYIADTENYVIRKMTPAGLITTLAGLPRKYGASDGIGGQALFARPRGVAADMNGNLYVADTENDTIRKISPEGVVSTIAGSPAIHENADGVAYEARFDAPTGLAIDLSGNFYVSENGHGRIIRKISPEGLVTTFAGCTNFPNCQVGVEDGVGESARFSSPMSVATDWHGNIYVGDSCTIRRITPDGVVTTIAGVYDQLGSEDGFGSSARFRGVLRGLAVDGSDNIYVSDTSSSTIRKMTPNGRVTTVAGSAGQQGARDGKGSAARFKWPVGLVVTSGGTLYVSDVGNHNIRKITPAGVVSTLAGSVSILDDRGAPKGGYADGIGFAARFNRPSGMALDELGNLLVSDEQNHAIRRVTPSGIVTTVAGAPERAGGADGIGAAAQFSGPEAVAIEGFGSIYVIDSGRVTKGTPVLFSQSNAGPVSAKNTRP